jgi:hypothetical protein
MESKETRSGVSAGSPIAAASSSLIALARLSALWAFTELIFFANRKT